MSKLQKRPPLTRSGPSIPLPATLQAGARYEDLPLAPPDQLPKLVDSPATPRAYWNTLPIKSNNPYFQTSSPLVSSFENIESRHGFWRDTAPRPSNPFSPLITLPDGNLALKPGTSPVSSSGSIQSAAWHADRHRSSSAPAANANRSSSRVAEDANDGMMPPQYKAFQSAVNDTSRQPSKTATEPCPSNCVQCGKRRPRSLVTPRQSGASSLPASSAQIMTVPPLHISKKCGPNCTKCGKRKANVRPTLAETSSHPPFNVPRPPTQAHTRSISEGAARLSSPLPFIPVAAGSSSLSPNDRPYKQCHTCGKPKRPASLPHPTPRVGLNISNSSDWPLPSPRKSIRQSTPIPLILGSFEGNQSTATITSLPFVANAEDSPLIAKSAADFNTVRNAAPRGSLTRRPDYTIESGPSALIRRLSNALRLASEPKAVASSAAATTERLRDPPDSSYLSVSVVEDTGDANRPFSFIGTANEDAFEMVDIRKSQPTQAESIYSEDMPQDDEKKGYSPNLSTPVAPDIEDEKRDQVGSLERDNTVMRRAVTGSIRRFKSLKGAHHNWYRNDMDISSAGDYYSVSTVVDVY